MSFAKKVVMPIMEGNAPPKEDVKEKIYGKMYKIIDIISKLSEIRGYDKQRRILLPDGQYMPNSNLAILITHAMSSGRVLHGENEFISLLYKARVDPELILNENVKNKLVTLYSKGEDYPPYETSVRENHQQQTSVKRKFIDVDVDNEFVNNNNERNVKRFKRSAIEKPSLKRARDEDVINDVSSNWMYPKEDDE